MLGNWNLIFISVFVIGFLVTMVMAFVLDWMRRLQLQSEAKELVEDAREIALERENEAKKKAQAYTDAFKRRLEREDKRVKQKLNELEEKVKAREELLIERFNEHDKNVSLHQSMVDSFDHRVTSLEKRVEQKRDKLKAISRDLINKLVNKANVQLPQVTEQIKVKELDNRKIELAKKATIFEEEWQNLAELEAKKLLTLVINRFARPYCPERGIGYLNFSSEDQKRRILANDLEWLRYVEKQCGVDLAYDEVNNAINVYGFDPVRRELGRATIEKLMSEKNINLQAIDRIVIKVKKDLLQRILNDGNRIANELKLDKVNPEIKNMMGALRYRYSFTQNQYFHCAEVGFLCGLLAAELEESVSSARRAGMLHDIGKAMDHSIDGGHAVIGADFISQRGEASSIVHAVRAHHFDETPDSHLAYLVIAADAISGARPGARRSTVATYTQKIQDLQTIARAFEGVQDTHVLSAGREVRVYVDGSHIDDIKALDLSKQIAHKIESDMQYPGQIKVTVVRETQAVEYAR